MYVWVGATLSCPITGSCCLQKQDWEGGLQWVLACYFCSRLSGALAWPWPGPTADLASFSLGSCTVEAGELCICWEWGKMILGASKPVAEPWSFGAAWPPAQGEAYLPRITMGHWVFDLLWGGMTSWMEDGGLQAKARSLIRGTRLCCNVTDSVKVLLGGRRS